MAGSLCRLDVRDFRCLRKLELEPAPGVNLILGANASGKTSLLEAIFVLGRGRSFRTAQKHRLIRDSAPEFMLAGWVGREQRQRRLGVLGRRQEALVARIDGEPAPTLAALSEVLAVEIIDPEIHKLVEEGPERRRRFMDWGAFHVEHDFLAVWGRYRKALRQRNALLQQHRPPGELRPWEIELGEAGTALTRMREAFLTALAAPLQRFSAELTDLEARIDFRPGWDRSQALVEVLEQNRERDAGLGRTLAGPHRAELVIELGNARARARVSRGQQKLLAASLVLAQLTVLGTEAGRHPVLLLDDPAAELDAGRVARLVAAVQQLNLQLFVSALQRDNLPDFADRTFHMEQGKVQIMV